VFVTRRLHFSIQILFASDCCDVLGRATLHIPELHCGRIFAIGVALSERPGADAHGRYSGVFGTAGVVLLFLRQPEVRSGLRGVQNTKAGRPPPRTLLQ
jgi:hypothetical protein